MPTKGEFCERLKILRLEARQMAVDFYHMIDFGKYPLDRVLNADLKVAASSCAEAAMRASLALSRLQDLEE